MDRWRECKVEGVVLVFLIWLAFTLPAVAGPIKSEGLASWYGEAHRGRLMANGEKFDPDKLTAASWFYPLGTQVRVTVRSHPQRSVIVTITDRGPAKRLVNEGRIIDLAHAAFKELASPDSGLVSVTVQQSD
jgi:rare lipoprotein A